MRRNAIKKGRTYVGRDGGYRTVNMTVEVEGRPYVGYHDHRTGTNILGVPLDQFARWAHKEARDA